MNETYKAVVCGKNCDVKWDDTQETVLVVDGNPHQFQVMHISPDVFVGQTLVRIQSVVFDAGFLETDGDELWERMARLRPKQFLNSENLSTYQSLDVLLDIARGRTGDYPALHEIKNKAVAVAWTKERSTWAAGCAEEGFEKPAYSVYHPVFLSVFKPAKKVRPSKSIARFERDFSLALIPRGSGKETPLTIESELQELIKKIVANGGEIPRTKLRNGKSDTWQPEKLLVSKVAKMLVKAGLLGTTKLGRTSVFWVKQSLA